MPPDTDLTVFCSLDVDRTGSQRVPTVPSEVVLLVPVIEILQTPTPDLFSALRLLPLKLFLLTPAVSLLLMRFLPTDNSLLLILDEYLHVPHLVEPIVLPLLLFVHLIPYFQSSPAAVVRRPNGNAASFPLELLSLPVLVVVPLPEGPSP